MILSETRFPHGIHLDEQHIPQHLVIEEAYHFRIDSFIKRHIHRRSTSLSLFSVTLLPR